MKVLSVALFFWKIANGRKEWISLRESKLVVANDWIMVWTTERLWWMTETDTHRMMLSHSATLSGSTITSNFLKVRRSYNDFDIGSLPMKNSHLIIMSAFSKYGGIRKPNYQHTGTRVFVHENEQIMVNVMQKWRGSHTNKKWLTSLQMVAPFPRK